MTGRTPQLRQASNSFMHSELCPQSARDSAPRLQTDAAQRYALNDDLVRQGTRQRTALALQIGESTRLSRCSCGEAVSYRTSLRSPQLCGRSTVQHQALVSRNSLWEERIMSGWEEVVRCATRSPHLRHRATQGAGALLVGHGRAARPSSILVSLVGKATIACDQCCYGAWPPDQQLPAGVCPLEHCMPPFLLLFPGPTFPTHQSYTTVVPSLPSSKGDSNSVQ
jgi:hypothetical protein